MTDISTKPAHGTSHTLPATRPAAVVDGEPHPVSRRRVLGAYKQMLASLFISTLVVIAAIMVMIVPVYVIQLVKGGEHSDSSSIFAIVVLAGALGALFSALIRLYNFADLPKALVAKELEELPGRYLFIYSLVPIVVGAIAAAVLYLVFAGKLLAIGNFTPEFDCIGGSTCVTFLDFVAHWSPKGGENFAKALVWGFVAGFAERLVPDTLRTLTRSVEDKSQSQKRPQAD
jgi:hypothetical protein